jgi:hypothetical protein
MAVTFIAAAVASAGIPMHWPVDPVTCRSSVSLALSGAVRPPMLTSPGRVSTSRQGSIATNTGLSPEPIAACPSEIPPAPSVTATAAPIAAHLLRYDVIAMNLHLSCLARV